MAAAAEAEPAGAAEAAAAELRRSMAAALAALGEDGGEVRPPAPGPPGAPEPPGAPPPPGGRFSFGVSPAGGGGGDRSALGGDRGLRPLRRAFCLIERTIA